VVKLSGAGLDAVFKALADPTRREITVALSKGDASMTELSAPLPMSLPAVSKHLRVLEDAGIVEGRKEGRVRYFQLVPAQLDAASEWVEAQSSFWRQRFDALHRFLEQGRAR
jgi:DNA-binding transcriptional ArsR family regulator